MKLLINYCYGSRGGVVCCVLCCIYIRYLGDGLNLHFLKLNRCQISVSPKTTKGADVSQLFSLCKLCNKKILSGLNLHKSCCGLTAASVFCCFISLRWKGHLPILMWIKKTLKSKYFHNFQILQYLSNKYVLKFV